MFGLSKATTTEALEKLVRNKKWDKIKKLYLNSDAETMVHLAEACSTSVCDDSSNVLMALLDSSDEKVKSAALHALEKVGNDHCVSRIQQVMSSLSPDQKELSAEFQAALHTLRGKQ